MKEQVRGEVRFDPASRALYTTDASNDRQVPVAFGGADYKDLYITTAGGNIRASDGAVAGCLFRSRFDVAGVAEFVSRIRLS